MTVDHERRAYSLFRDAVEMEPSARAGFLDAACSGDAALRREVEALLAAHAGLGSFLDVPAAESVAAAAPVEFGPGERIGSYGVIRTIGRGASGTVYEAEQARPRRRVALKVMHARLRSEEARRRFLDEAEVLGRLDHAGIARVFEAGVQAAPGGELPWFALEFVEDARTLTAHVAAEASGERERCALVAQACDAVHHAHQKGVLHRDLKPANVLVDRGGRIKLIDFGVAREVDASERPAGLAGTVAYMSPEQASPGDSHLDVRSDVYSLGVVLHEVLTGRLPRDVSDLPVAEALRLVASGPPPSLGADLGVDLAAITRKALAQRREDRYASAAALADDLRRHLEHRPVEAARRGALYAAAKFARRQPLAFAALCGVVAVSAAAGVVGTRLAFEKEEQRRATESQAYVAHVSAAAAALQLEDVAAARLHLERAPEALRNWEWYHLAGRLDSSERTIRWDGHSLALGAIDAEGRLIVAAGVDADPAVNWAHTLRAWDAASGAVLWDVPMTGVVFALAFSPDASRLAVGYSRGAVELRDAGTGALVAQWDGHGDDDRPVRERHVTAAVFEPGGRWFATSSGDGTVRLWDAATGAALRSLEKPGARVVCLALVPGGERIAAGLAGKADGSVVVWNLASGAIERRLEGHARSVDGVAVSPDGTRLVSASRDHTVRVWDLASGGVVASSAVHGDNVRDVAFSPAGDVFATASWDRTLALFRTSDGRQIARLRGHTNRVQRVAFLPGGRRLVSFAGDGTVKTWRTDGEHAVRAHRDDDDAFVAVAADAGGRFVVSATSAFGRRLRVWDVRADAPAADVPFGASSPSSLAVWPDGERFAAANRRQPVTVRRLPDAAPLAGPAGAQGPIALSCDGGVLHATADGGTRIVAWRTAPWAPANSWDAGGTVEAMAVSTDGSTLVTSLDAGLLAVWDTRTRTLVARRRVASRTMRQLAFAPSGRVFAACDGGESVRLYDARTLDAAGSLVGHATGVTSVAFSPDGTRIATSSNDATVRIWDAATLDPVAVLDVRPDPATCVAFTDAGRSILCGGGAAEVHGELRVFAAPGLPVRGERER